MRAIAFCLALAISSVAFVAVVAADDDRAAKAEARKLLDAGDKKLQSGDKQLARGKKTEAQDDYIEALAAYEAAFKAFPDAKIFFAIGLAEKRLGRYVDSLGHFNAFLDEVGDNEELRATVEEHTSEIKTYLAVIFFRIIPEGAVLEVDGKEVARSPLNRPHYIPPGEHTYAIRKDGFKSVSGTVEIEAGEARDDVIRLERDVQDTSDDDEEDDDDDDDVERPAPKSGKKSRRPLIVGLALTGGFALAASSTGLLALSRHNTFTDSNSMPQDRESARGSGKNFALATDVLLIGAIAAGTYTAYYYFAELRGDASDDEPNRAVLGPWVEQKSAGLVVGGRF